MRHKARVFDMASKSIHTSLVIRGYCFSVLISHKIAFKNNQNVGNFLLFLPSQFSKNGGRRIKVIAREYS